MPVESLAAEDRVLLSGVTWEAYEALLVDDGPVGGRLAYDEGCLEIMSPFRDHEQLKSALSRLVEAYGRRPGSTWRPPGR